jgi:hypothetical protein
MFETPISQRPLRGWDDSPLSAGTEVTDRTFNRHISPYSSNYNSPVSAIEAPHMNWPALNPQRLGEVQESLAEAPTITQQGQGRPRPAPPAGTSANGQPFAFWLAATGQDKTVPNPKDFDLQQEHQHAAMAIGVALGGDEASLRSKNSNQQMGDIKAPPPQSHYETWVGRHEPQRMDHGDEETGESEQESYELREVDNRRRGSPGANSSGSNASGSAQHYPHLNSNNPYAMPMAVEQRFEKHQPTSVLLHHPGYGRQKPGKAPTPANTSFGGLTEDDARKGFAV